ncbi:MAG: glycosyltransferase [Gemmatimonadota bacterium]
MSDKLRVLHILNELQPSGAETMLESAGHLLAADGIEARIMATGAQEGPYAGRLRAAGYEIVHLPFSKSATFARSFHKVVAAFRPDVVHLHTERAYFVYAGIVRLGLNTTIIRTVHHIFEFNGLLRMRKRVERWISRRWFRVRFYTNSPSNRENEATRFGNPCILIPNWYDDSLFTPPSEADRSAARRQLGVDDDTFLVVSVGGNWPYKNYHLIVQALADRRDIRPCKYLQVGPDPEGVVESMARELGIKDAVESVGMASEVLPYLFAADAFAMPSSAEGFGIAAVEALATGTIAVLSDVPALNDLKPLFPHAHWIEPNSETLGKAFEKIRGLDPAERVEVRLKSAHAALKHFGTGTGAALYRMHYEQLSKRVK